MKNNNIDEAILEFKTLLMEYTMIQTHPSEIPYHLHSVLNFLFSIKNKK